MLTGMRWQWDNNHDNKLPTLLFKWIKDLRKDEVFVSCGCFLDLPMIDIASNGNPEKGILSQWKYTESRKFREHYLTEEELRGVRRIRYPLWKSWKNEGGVTLYNTTLQHDYSE